MKLQKISPEVLSSKSSGEMEKIEKVCNGAAILSGCESRKLFLDSCHECPFMEARHRSLDYAVPTSKHNWRMKERMKTVSVALALCLNVGVDPPDVVKTSPCARLECWFDPLSMGQQKALETIGLNLQRQYERWQPRARYKQMLDPNSDEVKKLCTSLRRNAKEERVLFHYNGHGVPKPTSNGEVWVFNQDFTQYIPLSLYNLHTWMGSPSIYVYDCSSAGTIIDHLKSESASTSEFCLSVRQCIQLAACSSGEILPQNPEIPADLFTSCLTTPIKVALRWFVAQNSSKLVPGITMDLIDKIPGQLSDRRTMLGELNWIFTAITDTIAWNCLPRELFQKLFRQDLLVASLFRNFLLAERVMRSYNCHPLTCPSLPTTYDHPMWLAWDLALDMTLSQLPAMLETRVPFQHSNFFEEQLSAFQVWLDLASDERSPPEQLPIVLQVLLSQVHRLRALELLKRFLELGAWAVNLALSVGIFPYVLKLLTSCTRELKPLLVSIWSKILAVDNSCQVDLVKDNGHKYFLDVLKDPMMKTHFKTLSTFVLALVLNNYPTSQVEVRKNNLIDTCLSHLLSHLSSVDWQFRQWLLLCLAKAWVGCDEAREEAVLRNAVDEISDLLAKEEKPEVRVAGIYALGCFFSLSPERSDKSIDVDHMTAKRLLPFVKDASIMARKELALALTVFVQIYESQAKLAARHEEESHIPPSTPVPGGWNMISSSPYDTIIPATFGRFNLPDRRSPINSPPRVSIGSTFSRSPSHSSLSGQIGSSVSTVHYSVWKVLNLLCHDPHPKVVKVARATVNSIKNKLSTRSNITDLSINSANTSSEFHDQSPDDENEDDEGGESKLVFDWACKLFSTPKIYLSNHDDFESSWFLKHYNKKLNQGQLIKESESERLSACQSKLEGQEFMYKIRNFPTAIVYHPVEPSLIACDRDSIFVWNLDSSWRKNLSTKEFSNKNVGNRIKCLKLLNTDQDTLILTGTDDGMMKVWGGLMDDNENLVSAWSALQLDLNLHSKEYGLVCDWRQDEALFVAAGASKYIHLWDLHQERQVLEIATREESSLTCINFFQRHRTCLVAGGEKGTIRIYDTRKKRCEQTFDEHSARVVNAFVSDASEYGLTSASVDGEVHFWDIRNKKSIHVHQTNSKATVFISHPELPILAVGSENDIQVISILNHSYDTLSTINFYEGFGGRRISSTTCLAFHPYRVKLAAGFADSSVCTYGVKR